MNNVRAGTLAINAGTIAIAPNGTSNGASRVAELSIAGGSTPSATLDLNDNDLIVTSGSYSAVTALIASARNGGLWNGNGLTSSTAAAASPRNTTLGTLTGGQFLSLGQTTFDGFTVAGYGCAREVHLLRRHRFERHRELRRLRPHRRRLQRRRLDWFRATTTTTARSTSMTTR